MNAKLTINLEFNNMGKCIDFDIYNNTELSRIEYVNKEIDNPITVKEVIEFIKEEILYTIG